MRIPRLCALLLTALFLFSCVALPCFAAPQTVRVAYFEYPGFQEYSAENGYSGYVYDYLQEISKYTNWRYTFVRASFEDCLSLIKQGKADLMCGLQSTPERQANYCYSKLPCGTSNVVLLTGKDNRTYAYGDTERFQGMTVGLLSGSASNQDWYEYCAANDLKVENKMYQTNALLLSALELGEVDAISVFGMRPHASLRTIAEFAPNDFYFVGPAHRAELLSQLDNALEQIKVRDPFFELRLSERHYASAASEFPVFTTEELAYLETNPHVTAIYGRNLAPLEYEDPETGVFSGTVSRIFTQLSALTGITFDYVSQDNYEDELALLEAKGDTLLCSTAHDYSWAARHNLRLSKTYLTGPVLSIQNERRQNADPNLFALPKSTYLNERIARNYPEAAIRIYDTYAECFEAVERGEASRTFAISYLADELLRNARYSNLTAVALNGYAYGLSIGVSEQTDPRLLTILDKALGCITDDTVTEYLMEDAVAYRAVSLLDLFYQNPGVSAVMITAFLGSFILLLLIMLRNKTSYAKKLYALLNLDELTGVWSLTRFRSAANQLIANGGDGYVLLYVNISDFKLINDTYGYSVGDSVLRHICAVFGDALHGSELFARIHSDHFAVLLRCGSGRALSQRLDRLLKRIDEPLRVGEASVHVLLTIGVYPLEESDTEINAALDRAGYAREHIVAGHKSSYLCYDEKFRQQLMMEKELEAQMEQALQNGEFCVYYQPKVNCITHRIVGAEALIRWNHPQKGLIPPGVFLPLFEKNGFILLLDRWVFRTVCAQQAEWKRRGLTLFPISCNFSRLHLSNDDFPRELRELSHEFGIDRSLLEIEMTETIAIDNLEVAAHRLQQLKNYGFVIAIDDFGLGYSSLGILSQLPADVIKLDRSFINHAVSDASNRIILAGVIEMADALHKQVVCEGVEEESQVALLRSLNCGIIQGYYYSKPLPLDQFEQYAFAFYAALPNA